MINEVVVVLRDRCLGEREQGLADVESAKINVNR